MRWLMVITIALLAIPCCQNREREDSVFSVPDNYRTWKRPVGEVLDYAVPGHGQSYRIIYGNDLAFSAHIGRDRNGREKVVMPDGAIIIKEIFETISQVGQNPGILAIMEKDSKNFESIHGWNYYIKKPNATIESVKGVTCAGCHEAANEQHPYFDRNKKGIFRDYVFVNFIKEQ